MKTNEIGKKAKQKQQKRKTKKDMIIQLKKIVSILYF